MSARTSIQLACGLLGIAIVAGCTGGGPATAHHVTRHQAARHATVATPERVTRADFTHCQKTLPGSYPHEAMSAGSPPAAGTSTFPTTPTTAVIVHHFTPGSFAFGNGKLWTMLDQNGVLIASKDMVHPDGSIWWKFPWWRMVIGNLTITGRRLDATAPPLKSWVPTGYGDTGFQASGVIFPTEGCWQVTAKVAQTSLTFVAFVIAQAHRADIFSRHPRS
jgi:hypothetical protein